MVLLFPLLFCEMWMYAKENRDRKEKNIDLDNHIYYLQQNFIIEIHCNTFKTTKQKSTENKRFCI